MLTLLRCAIVGHHLPFIPQSGWAERPCNPLGGMTFKLGIESDPIGSGLTVWSHPTIGPLRGTILEVMEEVSHCTPQEMCVVEEVNGHGAIP
jgi:hypothetical protein